MSRRESDRNRKLRGMLAAQRAKTDACKRVAQEYRKMLTNAQTVAQLATDLLRERDAEIETHRATVVELTHQRQADMRTLHEAGENCVKAKAEVERLKADFTAAVVKAQNEGREKQAAAVATGHELAGMISQDWLREQGRAERLAGLLRRIVWLYSHSLGPKIIADINEEIGG